MPRTITHVMVWTHSNVSTFKGYSVNAQGEVELSDEEWEEILNETHAEVDVCGQRFDAGHALKLLDRVAFDQGKSDYESSLDVEFYDALENEDDSWITFAEYEPFEIDDQIDDEE